MNIVYIPRRVKHTSFSRLPPTEDSASESTASLEYEPPPKQTRIVYLFLTSIFIFFLFSLSFWMGTRWAAHPPSSILNWESITEYSPILEDLPLAYTTTRFNGSLLKPNVFREPAGPAVDTAWQSLGVDYRAVTVPPELALRAGFRPDQVKINPNYGGGYPANVEGLHHLHCLNLLRQALWYNFDYYNAKGEGAFKNEPYILQMHVSHCVDILRQELMCSVDIGVLGQVWIHPDAPEPYVDFNTQHKCRDFEAIRQWAEERQMPPADQVPDDFLDPPHVGDRVYEEIP